MQAATRAHMIAGAALIAAGGVAAASASLASSSPDTDPVSTDVRLVNDSLNSLANIPVNLLHDTVNIPYYLFAAPYQVFGTDDPAVIDEYLAFSPDYTGGGVANGAVNELAQSLNYTGNWFVYTPTNIWGWDPGDPPKLLALLNTLVPFPALSEPLGQQLNTIAEAELPMSPDCPFPNAACPNPIPLLTHSFQVPLQKLVDGYPVGEVVDIKTGTPVPWSDTTLQLDPNAPMNEFIASLTADPSTNPIQPFPSLATIASSFGDVGTALVNAFNPFVSGSFLFDWLGPFDPFGSSLSGADAVAVLPF